MIINRTKEILEKAHQEGRMETVQVSDEMNAFAKDLKRETNIKLARSRENATNVLGSVAHLVPERLRGITVIVPENFVRDFKKYHVQMTIEKTRKKQALRASLGL